MATPELLFFQQCSSMNVAMATAIYGMTGLTICREMFFTKNIFVIQSVRRLSGI